MIADTTYYYQIPAANGTTESDVLSFKTAAAPGSKKPFSIAILNDMGYTNAKDTYRELLKSASDSEISFAWHGGDISYADDWYSGILPCESDWPVCYNGSSTELPGPAPVPDEYKDAPLPKGEVANQGGPQGGDMSVLYESNWDLWQQWMSPISMKIPYQVLPGNHETTCAEFDGPNNELSAYLDHGKVNGTQEKSDLSYFSCPPSQRNFTAYQNRFTMNGENSGGVGNFWYSFDYGLAHFINLDSETDFPNSPSYTFAEDLDGKDGKITPDKTYVTDAGPFGKISGSYKENKAYEQWNWFQKDLASVDRSKTPWVFVMSHRPLYSSAISSYQANMRAAWEDLMLQYGVDAYFAGHIHWYERMLPLGRNGTIDTGSVKDNNTYYANNGKSITYITNGAAGNIESHSTFEEGEGPLNITQVVDFVHFGFGKLQVDECEAKWNYIFAAEGSVGDHVTLLKKNCKPSSGGGGGGYGAPTPTPTPVSSKPYSVTTDIVNSYTTYCPGATTFTQGSHTYTVTAPTTLTITDCPCTITHSVPVSTGTVVPPPYTGVPGNGAPTTVPAGGPPATTPTTVPSSGSRFVAGSAAAVLAFVALML